jgi:hypothetical protein
VAIKSGCQIVQVVVATMASASARLSTKKGWDWTAAMPNCTGDNTCKTSRHRATDVVNNILGSRQGQLHITDALQSDIPIKFPSQGRVRRRCESISAVYLHAMNSVWSRKLCALQWEGGTHT